jgi:hypothetical protein
MARRTVAEFARIPLCLAVFACLGGQLPRLHAGEAAPGQWIVVTAPAFEKALAPLCKQRRNQGWKVVVVKTGDVLTDKEILGGKAEKLRDHLHQLCRRHKGPSVVLLVGAVTGTGLTEATRKVVPALKGTIGRMKGEPTDHGYGCPGGGRLPSVAVGRFPARSLREVKGMVDRTLAYEDPKPGTWRRRLTILAGIPAYNPLVDRLVEGLAMARFAKLNPAWSGRAIYTNATSHFCVPDANLRKQALAYVEEGQAFLLYLGHSNPLGLYAGPAPFLNRQDWARLKIQRPSGVFFTFGCNGCQLTGNEGEGYGVAAMRNPHGPVAVVGSQGICFAAMVQLAADGMFASTFKDRVPEQLQTVWLAIEMGLARGKIDDFTYRLLDQVDGDPRIPQNVQRQEHLEMFVLLGDPALRLPQVSEEVSLRKLASLQAGEPLRVEGEVPARLAGGRVDITLERQVHTKPLGLEKLPHKPGKEYDRVMQANHERANAFVVSSVSEDCQETTFRARVKVPKNLPWKQLVLRVRVHTPSAEAMKVVVLPVPSGE